MFSDPDRRVVQFILGAALAMASTSLCLPTAWAGQRLGQAPSAQPGADLRGYGALVESLVANYNNVQEHQARLLGQLEAMQTRLAADRVVEDAAVATLRQVALASYMNGASDSRLFLLQGHTTITTAAEEEYAAIAAQGLTRAIDTVGRDERQTRLAESQLRATETLANASQGNLAQARGSAQAAVQEDIVLAQVDGDLSSLLESASQDSSLQRSQEQTLATNAAASPPAVGRPVLPARNPTPGRYLDPLRAIQALRPSRIDQGVDYTGYGPVYAIGTGMVLSTGSSGWPGGTFICYRLTAGRASGLTVYVAEDLVPLVTVGQAVTPQTVLGTMYAGPSGIETGWADPAADGSTMAGDARQFGGSNSTAFGSNFSQLLASLGAPSGVVEARAPTGGLPPNWPQW